MSRDKKYLRQMSNDALKKYSGDNDDYDIKREIQRRFRRNKKRPVKKSEKVWVLPVAEAKPVMSYGTS